MLKDTDGRAVLNNAGLDIAAFIERLDKQSYDPQRGDCVSFAVCLYELFDGDALMSCWVPHQVRGPPGTLHTACVVDGTLYDSNGITDMELLVDTGFEDLIEYSPPTGPPDLAWVNDADNTEVRSHAQEHLVREEAPSTVKRNASNYDAEAYQTIKNDFERTLERLRTR